MNCLRIFNNRILHLSKTHPDAVFCTYDSAFFFISAQGQTVSSRSVMRNQNWHCWPEKSKIASWEGSEELKFQKIHEDLDKTGLPKLLPGEEVVYHTAYALVYAEPYEQARWVAHIILPDVVKGNEGRTNDFRPDDKIKTSSAVEADYFLRIPLTDSTFKYDGFGYDRGHLAAFGRFPVFKKSAFRKLFIFQYVAPGCKT